MVTDPQAKYYDDQDILNVDFDQLKTAFISSIDTLRSHFNALEPNSQELNTPQYQESRCHTFYRMIGFPIVAPNGSDFHSPGWDPNLNIDADSSAAYKKIDKQVIDNNDIITQLKAREDVANDYRQLFSQGGVDAQAIALGSIFIRAFDKQFSGTPPLTLDASQTQTIDERNSEMLAFYPDISDAGRVGLISFHPLKPFIVDPRIDISIRPIKNKICAPFLKDKSQTKIFQSSSGLSEGLKRPYIERVISVRFNNSNQLQDQDYIKSVLTDIQESTTNDQDLISAVSNPLNALHQSELVIFNNYFKIIRIVIDNLVAAIKGVQDVRLAINFNPVQDTRGGIESGGDLAPIIPNDNRNKEMEKNILTQSQKKAINDIILDTGIRGIPDPGDFAFSNLDDTVFSINKSVQKSFDEHIKKLVNNRNTLGDNGIELLKNIEIIMGEFSGIGLIDMIAIQAALWIMPANSLLGLIDQRAFDRITAFRDDINLPTATPNDIITSLTDFEATLKTIYLLIQDYFNSVNSGSAFST